MGRSRNATKGIVIAGLVAAAVAAPPGQARTSRAHAAATCTAATNVEAIIDDSGSMAGTDSNLLRVKGLKLLINTLSGSTTLGAVEFGSAFDPSQPSADTVFAPQPVGPNAAAMGSALDTKILADNGGTDYNAAFAQSDHDNPNAQARIFLTDGGHNAGDYANGHLTHKVPTYVIGFSTAILDPDSAARLQAIASDTGGQYLPVTDSNQLQAVMNNVGASLTCQQPPKQFTDQLAQGASKTHAVSVPRSVKSLQIALTWSSPLDSFAISRLRLVSHGKTIAMASKQVAKLKVKRTTSPTFTLLKISRLKPGKLTFSVKATKIGSGTPKVTLVTQVGARRK